MSTSYGRLFVAWGIQQVAVPVSILTLVLVASGPLEGLLHRGPDGAPDPGLEDLVSTAVFWALGFVLALLVRRVLPSAATTGKWIWPLPTATVAAALASDLARFGPHEVVGYFYPKGEDGWPAVLFVFPTYACVAYSIGMARRSIGRTPQGRGR
jgi:hypothetical protein